MEESNLIDPFAYVKPFKQRQPMKSPPLRRTKIQKRSIDKVAENFVEEVIESGSVKRRLNPLHVHARVTVI